MSEPSNKALGELFSLVVHDLRNPTATVSANLAFVREVGAADDFESQQDLQDALDDAQVAVSDIMRGLEQVAWVARSMVGEPGVRPGEGDIARELDAAAARHKHMRVDVQAPVGPLRAKGSMALAKVLDTLLANSEQHAPGEPVMLKAYSADERTAVVELQDRGKAVAADLRAHAFTIEGQHLLKGRLDGRYSRVVGLFAVATLLRSAGGDIEAAGEDGRAVFRIMLPLVTVG